MTMTFLVISASLLLINVLWTLFWNRVFDEAKEEAHVEGSAVAAFLCIMGMAGIFLFGGMFLASLILLLI